MRDASCVACSRLISFYSQNYSPMSSSIVITAWTTFFKSFLGDVTMSNNNTSNYRRILIGIITAGLLPAIATIPFALVDFPPALEYVELVFSPPIGEEGPVASAAKNQQTWEELKIETEGLQIGFENVLLAIKSIQEFESKFLKNDALNSFARYLQDTDNADLTTTPWEPPLPQSSKKQKDDTSYVREITYMHPVQKPMAPPMARSIKQQRIQHYGKNRLVIETWTTVEDVPKADCFVVQDRILVESIKDGLDFSGWFQIHFTKKTMVRSIIEKTTSREFVEFLQGFIDMVRLATSSTIKGHNHLSSDLPLKMARGGGVSPEPRLEESRLPWLSFVARKRLLSLQE